jgi:hypothetical protein
MPQVVADPRPGLPSVGAANPLSGDHSARSPSLRRRLCATATVRCASRRRRCGRACLSPRAAASRAAPAATFISGGACRLARCLRVRNLVFRTLRFGPYNGPRARGPSTSMWRSRSVVCRPDTWVSPLVCVRRSGRVAEQERMPTSCLSLRGGGPPVGLRSNPGWRGLPGAWGAVWILKGNLRPEACVVVALCCFWRPWSPR